MCFFQLLSVTVGPCVSKSELAIDELKSFAVNVRKVKRAPSLKPPGVHILCTETLTRFGMGNAPIAKYFTAHKVPCGVRF